MPRSRAITSLVLVLALVVAQRGSFNIDAMVEAGEALVANALILDTGWTADRYNVAAEGIRTSEIAAAGIQAELHGVYGEFPLRGMAELLTNPAVVGSSSVMSNALSFVDIGSGAGRLLLGVAGMLGDEATVTGIEASSALYVIAEKAITELVSQGKLRPGSVSSLLADVIMQPPEPTMARTFAQADVIFCYSTAFPSEDGLRLPELSAALATLLRADSVVITTDKVRAPCPACVWDTCHPHA